MKRHWKFLVLAVVFCLVPVVCGLTDYHLISRHKRPVFAFYYDSIFDGGTRIGYGAGYTVYFHHGCHYSTLHGKSWADSDWAEGPQLSFWIFPYSLLDREKVVLTKRKPPVAANDDRRF